MLSFFRQYIKNPRMVGAVAPSSKKLAKAMVSPVSFSHASCIVEFGPGTGVFTDELIHKRKKGTILVLVEQNREFYKLLKKKYYNQKNMVLINGSAEDADHILGKYGIYHADYIISGLPFASLPEKVSDKIIKAVKNIIGSDGIFITFQYTMLKRKFFLQHFKLKDCIYVFKNLPPANVFVMECRRYS